MLTFDTANDLANPLPLAQALIRRPSVTPVDAGALDVLEAALEQLGFACRRYPFGEVDNLYARRGTASPCFLFAGHTDVVPPGADADWQRPPFGAEAEDGLLWGRGAADMKGAIAAMVASVQRFLDAAGEPNGSIAFLITGDEEGPAIDGTKAVLKALADEGEQFDHCLVGEPTNPNQLGDTIKSGRRGSLNCTLTVTGRQGHVAYPERAENPIPPLLTLLGRLMARKLDDGVSPFQPSNLEVTSVDVGNPTTNVIPATATARFNIRFNIAHTGDALSQWIRDEVAKSDLDFDGRVEADIHVTGEAFLTPAGAFTTLLQDCVEAETGRRPALTTGGGTSDARFIQLYAPVAEFGLVGATMHQVDEHVAISDIETLTAIYTRILTRYFQDHPA
ncbi:succinyl-diaminopimelate desuccinylase [Maricaulis sp. W15]|uniref:succinyl-diaminopimelate desuccinylase n=1 Tax=Maricaulis sp. W15 TaxID=1772333 RepID=UPI0009489015|nr:succinyl-diaminopimelate desuccinylase [Maricaulis sp. W15]